MQFVMPNSIICQYNAQMGSFVISWNYTKPFRGTNPGTIIVEIGEGDGGWIFDVDSIYRIPPDTLQQNIMPTPNNSIGITHFLVIGVDNIYADDLIYQLRKYLEDKSLTDCICMGMLSTGRVTWEMKILSKEQVHLKIHSTVSIPIGFLYYSYRYLNVEFQYPILIPIIPNSEENQLTISMPHFHEFEVDSFTLFSCGTGLGVQKEKDNGKVKKNGCLRKLFEILGNR